MKIAIIFEELGQTHEIFNIALGVQKQTFIIRV
jgi:hypothetical protein